MANAADMRILFMMPQVLLCDYRLTFISKLALISQVDRVAICFPLFWPPGNGGAGKTAVTIQIAQLGLLTRAELQIRQAFRAATALIRLVFSVWTIKLICARMTSQ